MEHSFKNNINIVKTPEEYEKVCRFRYQIYVKEMGRDRHLADHEKKLLAYKDDKDEGTDIFYIGDINDVEGTATAHSWKKKDTPKHYYASFKLDTIDCDENTIISWVSKVMLRNNLRGLSKAPSFIAEGVDYLMKVKNTEYCFAACNLGLIYWYRSLGWQVIGRGVSPSGFVAFVTIMNTKRMTALAKSNRNFILLAWYMFSRRNAGLNYREPVLIMNNKQVLQRIKDCNIPQGFFANLSHETLKVIAQHGFVLKIDKGMELASIGLVEKEIYIILSGKVDIIAKDKTPIATLGTGEVFGEMAFFSSVGKRSAIVKVSEEGFVLVLHRKSIKKIAKKQPKAAYEIVHKLGSIVTDRLVKVERITTKMRLKGYKE